MHLKFLVVGLFFLVAGCICNVRERQPATSYNTISGWDISYIPIFEPYRLASVDRGVTWIWHKGNGTKSDVKAFGVSGNVIYGQERRGWFLLDTKTKLLAEYASENELLDALKEYDIPVNKIADCDRYFDTLAAGKSCYWFPADGVHYPDYPSQINPKDIITLRVSEKAGMEPNFSIGHEIRKQKGKIYFFKVDYNRKENDIYYLSFNYSSPVLIRDSLIVPVFVNSNEVKVTVYTPYPVGQEKGIPEEKRVVKSRDFALKD